MSFSSNQSGEKKRTLLEVIEISSDEDDDDLLAHTGPIFTKKTKTPDGAPSSSSASSAFFSEKDSKPPAIVKSSYTTPKPFPEVSSSSPDNVGSNSTTPLFVKSSKPVPVTVESSATSPFLIGSRSSPQDEPPLSKVESSYAKTPMPMASVSSVKPEPVVSTVLRTAAGPESSSSSPSPTPIASSSLPDVKPAALSTLTPLGYVTFPIQDIKGSTAATTMMTTGQRLTMSSQPQDGSIGLYDGSTKANVGSMDKRYTQHVVPLLGDRAETISMRCIVAQYIPGLTILMRIEVFYKAQGLGPPPAALLQTIQAELQTKLQKVGWTPGTAPPIHRNSTGVLRRDVVAGSVGGVMSIPHQTATTMAAADNPLHNNQERVFDDDTEDQEHLEETEQGQDQLESSFGKVNFEDFLGPVAYASEKEVEIDVEKLDKVFDALQTQQLSDLPQVAMPKHLSSVKFYKYQEDGVRWLLKQEKQERIPPWFVERSSGNCTKWVCQITGAIQLEKPGLVCGSVLADDMVR
jgi:hypothetical protein